MDESPETLWLPRPRRLPLPPPSPTSPAPAPPPSAVPAPARPPAPAPLPGRPASRHLRAVDGLRALAILAVLLYDSDWLPRGRYGVDVFLVLGGFVITLLLLRESLDGHRVGILAGYARRFKQLLLPLTGTVLATLAATYLLGGVHVIRQTGADAIAALLQLANWQQIHSGQSIEAPLGHLWALSLVEQFTVVGTVVIALLGWLVRRSAWAVTLLLGLAFAGSAVIAPLQYTGANADRLYFGSDTRAVDLIAGAFAAALVFVLDRRRGGGPGTRTGAALSTVVGLASLAGIVWVNVTTPPSVVDWYYRGGMAGIAAATALLIVAVGRPNGPLVRLLSVPTLVELGKTAYIVFLLHLPVFWVLRTTLPNLRPYAVLVIGGMFSWLVAQLLHYPLGERLTTRRWRGYVAVPLVLLLTGAVVAAGRYLPDRTEATLRPAGRAAILVLGDGLAGDLARAMAGSHLAAVDGSIPHCGALAAPAGRLRTGRVWPATNECRDRAATWQRLAQAEYRAIVVYLGWDAADQLLDGTWTRPCDQRYQDAYPERLKAAIGDLWATRPGTPVLLATVPPPSVADESSAACYNQLIASFASTTETSLIDLNALLCPHADCTRTDPAGDALYGASGDFTAAGRRFVGPLLVGAIAAHIP